MDAPSGEASRQHRRSIIVFLAGVLQRRPLIKTDLMSKDDGSLFEIANRYDLRHQNRISTATTTLLAWMDLLLVRRDGAADRSLDGARPSTGTASQHRGTRDA